MDNFFDNKTKKVGDDLKNTISRDSILRIAASVFTIYGFDSLKKQLGTIKQLKFIFTNSAFLEEDQNSKQQRQFTINANALQKAVAGSQFEINLKNELKGRSIARESQKWIEDKATFKSNKSGRYIQPQTIVDSDTEKLFYNGIDEFSSAGLGYENDNSMLRQIIKIDDATMTNESIANFESVWTDGDSLQDVTSEVMEYIANLYKENSPEFIYYLALYNIFDEFLEDITEDELANEKTGFKESAVWNMLYDFQKDAVLGIINKLERHNGCILADSVGLGKTFSALGVIKYYQERNKSILVLCPKKLSDNWQTFLGNYEDNPLIEDRFNYHILYHTDLSRYKGYSNNIDLSRVNWGNYDLVVIDESHNFRNNIPQKDRETRYQRLLNQVMSTGVKTKVLMLSATPVNNKFTDLKNQIALAYEGQTDLVDEKMDVTKSINSILQSAQTTFNDWARLPVDERTSKHLLDKLSSNFDFFKLLDNITISRSRKHITRYYDSSDIGQFPNRLKPITIRSDITNLDGFIEIQDLYNELSKLNLSLYAPSNYILESKKEFYSILYDTYLGENSSFSQSSREKTLLKLQRVNLLKRLESSIDSFRLTLGKFIGKNEAILTAIEKFEQSGQDATTEATQFDEDNYDEADGDWLDEEYSIGEKVKINLADMNIKGWQQDLEHDLHIAKKLLKEAERVTPEYDNKLEDLKDVIQSKIENHINEGNNKILIFSAFADTTNYLYENISGWAKDVHGLETAKVTGSDRNKCTLPLDAQFNNLLIHFSPRSKGRHKKHLGDKEIDILIATDCISEGQNLQDCDTLVNYDIHWNPVRIIQRFGRIDRIGSINKDVQLINFWPQLSLDDYINLSSRVENKMVMVDLTATGEDNVLTNESSDLLFRKKQLEKLQVEVVDIEDMDSSVSLTDLGLNDFRMDLVSRIKDGDDLKTAPNGMHTVAGTKADIGAESGVIFVLKNINNEVNIDNTNQLHPFYLVYIDDQGEIISDHLNIKHTLDVIRSVSKGHPEAIKDLYEPFNEETEDGKKMEKYSSLLNQAISSIIDVKESKDIDSLFSSGGTTTSSQQLKGLEDFELITFIVVR